MKGVFMGAIQFYRSLMWNGWRYSNNFDNRGARFQVGKDER
jgi:hypothetical protein